MQNRRGGDLASRTVNIGCPVNAMMNSPIRKSNQFHRSTYTIGAAPRIYWATAWPVSTAQLNLWYNQFLLSQKLDFVILVKFGIRSKFADKFE